MHTLSRQARAHGTRQRRSYLLTLKVREELEALHQGLETPVNIGVRLLQVALVISLVTIVVGAVALTYEAWPMICSQGCDFVLTR